VLKFCDRKSSFSRWDVWGLTFNLIEAPHPIHACGQEVYMHVAKKVKEEMRIL